MLTYIFMHSLDISDLYLHNHKESALRPLSCASKEIAPKLDFSAVSILAPFVDLNQLVMRNLIKTFERKETGNDGAFSDALCRSKFC